jgi:hypothetical protein
MRATVLQRQKLNRRTDSIGTIASTDQQGANVGICMRSCGVRIKRQSHPNPTWSPLNQQLRRRHRRRGLRPLQQGRPDTATALCVSRRLRS